MPHANVLLTDSTSMSRRPPASSKPAQQPLAVNKFFKGRGLKLADMQTLGMSVRRFAHRSPWRLRELGSAADSARLVKWFAPGVPGPAPVAAYSACFVKWSAPGVLGPARVRLCHVRTRHRTVKKDKARYVPHVRAGSG